MSVVANEVEFLVVSCLSCLFRPRNNLLRVSVIRITGTQGSCALSTYEACAPCTNGVFALSTQRACAPCTKGSCPPYTNGVFYHCTQRACTTCTQPSCAPCAQGACAFVAQWLVTAFKHESERWWMRGNIFSV